MAIVKSKPTSPGSRFVVRIKSEDLHKGKPYAPLLAKNSKTGGRNNQGRITTRHVGGGHKQHYRIIDFKRNKTDIPGVVERLEYDPNRTANIALVLFKDGERRYIIAPKGLTAGQEVLSSDTVPVKPGNCMPLAQHSDGYDRTLCRTEARQGRAVGQKCGRIGAIGCARWRSCNLETAFRRNAQSTGGLSRSDRRSVQLGAQPGFPG